MKKITKKTTKHTEEESPVISTLTSEKCTACNGSGLWRPDFTNSPQCQTCVGHGVITI